MSTLKGLPVQVSELEEQYQKKVKTLPVDAFIRPLAKKLLPYFLGRTYQIIENVSGTYTIVFTDPIKPPITLHIDECTWKSEGEFSLITDLDKYLRGGRMGISTTGSTSTLSSSSSSIPDYSVPMNTLSIEDIVLHLNNLKSLKKETQGRGSTAVSALGNFWKIFNSSKKAMAEGF